MRTTINVDDELPKRATELFEGVNRTALIGKALTASIQRESAKRLAQLGGTEPGLKAAPRRRLARAKGVA